MNLKSLSYAHILAIADVWCEIGGVSNIEIGALEPLLWQDKQYRIHDVVKALKEHNINVSITTNGQLLNIFADKLSHAGLSLIRTSWHSTDPLIFREISGGYGDYNRFLDGIILALKSGLKINFNRILLKGHTDDIPKQLSLIEEYKSRIKFYSLLWTPNNVLTYNLFYQDWHSVVRKLIIPNTLEITRVKKQIGRNRLQFHLIGGGLVEIKLEDKIDRSMYPYKSCPFKNECKEEFGDYVRVDPHLNLYFCYLRRDLGLRIPEYFGKPNLLKQKMQEIFGDSEIDKLLKTAPLRLTITPFCNFNCRAHGVNQSLCMEEPGEFLYPKIKESLLRIG